MPSTRKRKSLAKPEPIQMKRRSKSINYSELTSDDDEERDISGDVSSRSKRTSIKADEKSKEQKETEGDQIKECPKSRRRGKRTCMEKGNKTTKNVDNGSVVKEKSIDSDSDSSMCVDTRPVGSMVNSPYFEDSKSKSTKRKVQGSRGQVKTANESLNKDSKYFNSSESNTLSSTQAPRTSVRKNAQKTRKGAETNSKSKANRQAGATAKMEKVHLSDNSDSEWEEVVDSQVTPNQSQADTVEITLEAPQIMKKRQSKECDWMEYMRLYINKMRRQDALCARRTHQCCLLTWSLQLSALCNASLVRALALSLAPTEVVVPSGRRKVVWTEEKIISVVSNFRSSCSLESYDYSTNQLVILRKSVLRGLQDRSFNSPVDFSLACAALLRALGVETRLVCVLNPMTHKCPWTLPKFSKNMVKPPLPKKGSNPDTWKRVEVSEPPVRSESCKEIKPTVLAPQNTQEVKSEPNSPETSSDQTGMNKSGDIMSLLMQFEGSQLSDESDLEEVDSNIGLEVKPDIKPDVTSSYKKSESVNSTQNDERIDGKKTNNQRKPISKRKRVVEEIENILASSDVSDTEVPAKTKVVHKKAKKDQKPTKSSKKKAIVKDDDGSDFEEEKEFRKSGVGIKSKKISKADKVKDGRYIWLEVYIPKNQQWLCLDCIGVELSNTSAIAESACQPLVYAVAVDNDGKVKDVTSKYAEKYLTVTRKLRVDDENWMKLLNKFAPKGRTSKQEDKEMTKAMKNQPIPNSIAEIKGHPLYVLGRHLLKFEALYPADVMPVGYLRNEAVYRRENVHMLHTQETWMKEGRTVKEDEIAYKWVKSRPRPGRKKEDPDKCDLPVYGRWQTEVYVPPPAENGIIPRNRFGNVELFVPSMLPAGTVHLDLPGLGRIAKKLKIDAAAAMVGWEQHKGRSCPILDGWVVCIEHEKLLTEAWEQDQQDQILKECQRKEERVLQNWKKLVKGLLIGERLKRRFEFMAHSKPTKLARSTNLDDDLPLALHQSWPQNRLTAVN